MYNSRRHLQTITGIHSFIIVIIIISFINIKLTCVCKLLPRTHSETVKFSLAEIPLLGNTPVKMSTFVSFWFLVECVS